MGRAIPQRFCLKLKDKFRSSNPSIIVNDCRHNNTILDRNLHSARHLFLPTGIMQSFPTAFAAG